MDRRPPAHDRPHLPARCRPERPAPTLEDRPRPELVGTSATAGPLAGAAVLEARYDPGIDLDLEGGASDRDAPVLVRGFVDADQGTEVAVAVNGTVAATTTVMEDDSFAVLVDPSLYAEGSNRMEVFRLPPAMTARRRETAAAIVAGPMPARGYSSVG